MSYTREERLDIGKQIYNNEISKTDAAIKYSISEGTARDYMRLYRDVNETAFRQKTEYKKKKALYKSVCTLLNQICLNMNP